MLRPYDLMAYRKRGKAAARVNLKLIDLKRLLGKSEAMGFILKTPGASLVCLDVF